MESVEKVAIIYFYDEIETFIYKLYKIYNMAFKRISITADEDDIIFLDENMISKSALFQKAIKDVKSKTKN